jgi:hypothetical protein
MNLFVYIFPREQRWWRTQNGCGHTLIVAVSMTKLKLKHMSADCHSLQHVSATPQQLLFGVGMMLLEAPSYWSSLVTLYRFVWIYVGLIRFGLICITIVDFT